MEISKSMQRIELIRKVAELLIIYPDYTGSSGSKIRVGNLKNQWTSSGRKSAFEARMKRMIYSNPVDYAGIADDVKKGDKILLNDGQIELKYLKPH
jgi:pyruvate kinase